jgi:hypothetical protein
MKSTRIAIATLVIAAVSFFVHSASFAAPILVSSRAALAGDEFIDWGVLGSPGGAVSNPFAIASNAGLVNATVSMPTGTFTTRQQTADWFGNFAPGDGLLWTANETGPLTIAFDTPVMGAGAQIQPDLFGAFTAQITVFDTAGNTLAVFDVAGDSHGAADNSAIFLGVRDSIASIGRIAYALEAFGEPDEFAINRLDLVTPLPLPVPEPGMLLLLASGLLLLLMARNRQRSTATG